MRSITNQLRTFQNLKLFQLGKTSFTALSTINVLDRESDFPLESELPEEDRKNGNELDLFEMLSLLRR